MNDTTILLRVENAPEMDTIITCKIDNRDGVDQNKVYVGKCETRQIVHNSLKFSEEINTLLVRKQVIRQAKLEIFTVSRKIGRT